MPDERKEIQRVQTNYSEADKLYWEVERLKQETKNLKRPFLRNPNALVTVLTILVAVFGVLIQYSKSHREYQLAEIKRQQADLDTRRLSAQLSETAARYEDMKKQLNDAEVALAVKRRQLESTEALRQSPPEVYIFDNSNIYLIKSGPTQPTQFTISDPHYITSIWDYHWNNGAGAEPGGRGIRLRHNDGTEFGPWNVTTSSGQGSAANVNWDCAPGVIIPAGTYTVLDPDPATWSQNDESGNRGFTRIRGYSTRN